MQGDITTKHIFDFQATFANDILYLSACYPIGVSTTRLLPTFDRLVQYLNVCTVVYATCQVPTVLPPTLCCLNLDIFPVSLLSYSQLLYCRTDKKFTAENHNTLFMETLYKAALN